MVVSTGFSTICGHLGPLEGVETTRMLAIAAERDPEEIERVVGMISDAGINMRAFAADDAGVRIFCSDPDKAKQTLMDAGMFSQIVDVLSIQVGDRPGILRDIMKNLAGQGIKIVSTFGIGVEGTGLLFIRVEDLDHALKVLADAPDSLIE